VADRDADWRLQEQVGQVERDRAGFGDDRAVVGKGRFVAMRVRVARVDVAAIVPSGS
jgi:hypothetical protein